MLQRIDTPRSLTCDRNPAPVVAIDAEANYHQHVDDVWTCRGTLTAKFVVGA